MKLLQSLRGIEEFYIQTLMARVVIELAGLKGSGKDTVADFLENKHEFIKYAFAGPLKEACQNLFMLTEEQINGVAKDHIDPRYNLSAWSLLQLCGTNFVRNQVSQDFWVDRFSNWLVTRSSPHIVVSDVRVANEVQKIHALGGKVYMVHRPGLPTEDQHISEQPQDLPDIDGHICNDKDVETLYKHAIEVLEGLKCKSSLAGVCGKLVSPFIEFTIIIFSTSVCPGMLKLDFPLAHEQVTSLEEVHILRYCLVKLAPSIAFPARQPGVACRYTEL